VICKTVDSGDNLVNEDSKIENTKCRLCQSLLDNSQYVLQSLHEEDRKSHYFIISSEQNGLPVGPNKYLSFAGNQNLTLEELFELHKSKKICLYAKNVIGTNPEQSISILVGEYAAHIKSSSGESRYLDFAQMAQESEGIKRLAVLRCDVDDLGQAFISGTYGEEGSTTSLDFTQIFDRSTSFSHELSVFFKYYLNLIAKTPEFTGLTKRSTEEIHQSGGRKIQVIYSGGDDVFVVGAWDDVVEFAVDLRTNFAKWTDNKLTLSAGIGIFTPKTPVSQMAELTGDLE
jgi:CRISPR-associated protein Csm1